MDYAQTLDYIHSLNKFGKKAGLNNITRLLSLMGNPQDKCKFVHVAGTNGKGSTTTMIANVLKQAGYKTGKYISPFIIDFCERMQVNNEMISQEELIECTKFVKGFADEMTAQGDGPVEFEIVTAIAFEWYARQKCDIVVLEVGLGGSFDATNVISAPLAAVICSISLDHVEILGDTIGKIAHEKSGIIKKGSVTICYPDQHPDALAVIKDKAQAMGTRFIMGNASDAKVIKSGLEGTELTYKNLNIYLPLIGEHQVMNFINALEALFLLREQYSYNITDEDIINGIKLVRFPARMEILNLNPTVILDGAHNQSGIDVLAKALKMVKGRKISMIIGMLGDKDFSHSLRDIAILANTIYTVTPPTPRALDSHKLANQLMEINPNTTACDSSEDAFHLAIKGIGANDVLVICGSLYLASDMRKIVMDYYL